MENHFCNHQKFGYHKFAMHCHKEYMKEKCKALSACKDIKFATKNIQRFAKDLPSRTSVNLENSVYLSTWFEKKNKKSYNEMFEDAKNLKAKVNLLKKYSKVCQWS